MTAPRSIEELRKVLLRERHLHDSKADGRDGEEYARVWMRSRGIHFVDIPQRPGEIPTALKAMGGKRPDFGSLWDNDEVIVWLDAKHHNVESGEFWMHCAEADKYKQLELWSRQEWPDTVNLVAFVVVAKALGGTQIYIVGLDELIKRGDACIRLNRPSRSISLAGKEADW